MTPPARYFPVSPGQYMSRAQVHKWGTDFGNPQDQQYFQVDDQYERYVEERRNSPYKSVVLLDDSARKVHDEVLGWIIRTVRREFHPANPLVNHPQFDHRECYNHIGDYIQEDLTILQRMPDGTDRQIMLDVRFPTGWDPIPMIGKSFQDIHGRVGQDFTPSEDKAKHFVDLIVDRGPWVRFIWTPAQCDYLSLHPAVPRPKWSEVDKGWFRVERQVTVPFPQVNASLFLIRVYNYTMESLTQDQRASLISVIRGGGEGATYKGFDMNGADMVRLLRAA